ncbi:MAG: cytochrome b [Hyphomicrobium sp.]
MTTAHSTPARGRYSPLSMALHWLTLALIVGVYSAIELREYWPRGSPERDALKAWHFTFGLTVFMLTLARIAARVARPAPPILPPPAPWQRAASKTLQGLLYTLLIAMPLAGWTILSAEGNAIPFWGIELPAIAAKDKDWADIVEYWHKTFGKVGYALIGLHAAAAIAHHLFRKDNTLLRMLPGKRAA